MRSFSTSAWASGQAITLMIDDGTARTINWSSLAPVWITGGGSPPVLTGSEFRTMRELIALRAEIERLRLEGHSTAEILSWSKLTQEEYEDQLHAMRRTGIYDMRHWHTRLRPTRAAPLRPSRNLLQGPSRDQP